VGDGEPAESTAEATISINITGNTVYSIQLMLNAETNTLYLSSFVNLDWQVGDHSTVEL